MFILKRTELWTCKFIKNFYNDVTINLILSIRFTAPRTTRLHALNRESYATLFQRQNNNNNSLNYNAHTNYVIQNTHNFNGNVWVWALFFSHFMRYPLTVFPVLFFNKLKSSTQQKHIIIFNRRIEEHRPRYYLPNIHVRQIVHTLQN